MYQYIFLDLDDTILDFHKAEAIAVTKAFVSLGIAPTEALVCRYSEINQMHWQMLERGECTREQVLVDRFAHLFQERGIQANALECKESYENFLCMGHYFITGAEEILPYLAEKYQLYLASNGTARVQDSRLKSAGIRPYFQDVFVSERMGSHKPSLTFFEACFAQIPGFDRAKALMIGDSLTSDMQGGGNAGIDTCWYNPKGAARMDGMKINYEIQNLLELKTFL